MDIAAAAAENPIHDELDSVDDSFIGKMYRWSVSWLPESIPLVPDPNQIQDDEEDWQWEAHVFIDAAYYLDACYAELDRLCPREVVCREQLVTLLFLGAYMTIRPLHLSIDIREKSHIADLFRNILLSLLYYDRIFEWPEFL